jgi:hypothetical protein
LKIFYSHGETTKTKESAGIFLLREQWNCGVDYCSHSGLTFGREQKRIYITMKEAYAFFEVIDSSLMYPEYTDGWHLIWLRSSEDSPVDDITVN